MSALVLGVLDGLTIGLLALGIVLVHPANRFINPAQGQLGALSASGTRLLLLTIGDPVVAGSYLGTERVAIERSGAALVGAGARNGNGTGGRRRPRRPLRAAAPAPTNGNGPNRDAGREKASTR